MPFVTPRQSEIRRLRALLVATGFPRLKMLLLVGLTGGAGFLASAVMLRGGVASMAIRYPLAVGIAYLVFLFLLWLWLRTSVEDYVDVPDLSGFTGSGSAESPNTLFAARDLPAGEEGGALSEVMSGAAQADELAIPLILIAVVAAIALSSLWIVYAAPTLFAELLVDGALSAKLYRRLRGIEPRHWLETAIRRTFWPFAITALILSLSGAVVQHLHPTAHSLGEVIRSR